ncbi:MAG: NADH-quinone oxidoreductase subunit C [Firmicutes bacterium]|nr:NADH-quinone oxidoreductase subunit C [Bacillota bacterium]
MANEEAIKKELEEKFDFLKDKIIIPRERRLFTEPVEIEDFLKAIEYAASKMDFDILTTITGLDEGESIVAIYHLARKDGTMLNLKSKTPKENPVMKTISNLFNGAVFYERELVDMLGVQMEGLPEGKRYPLPDDWPEGQYPLRKEWKREMLDAKP